MLGYSECVNITKKILTHCCGSKYDIYNTRLINKFINQCSLQLNCSDLYNDNSKLYSKYIHYDIMHDDDANNLLTALEYGICSLNILYSITIYNTKFLYKLLDYTEHYDIVLYIHRVDIVQCRIDKPILYKLYNTFNCITHLHIYIDNQSTLDVIYCFDTLIDLHIVNDSDGCITLDDKITQLHKLVTLKLHGNIIVNNVASSLLSQQNVNIHINS